MTQFSDIWLFQDGLAIRIVGLMIWHDVALQMAKSVRGNVFLLRNATLLDVKGCLMLIYQKDRRKNIMNT